MTESGPTIIDLQATDDSGSVLHFVTRGSVVHITSSVASGSGTTVNGSFMYAVQVKDPDNKVTFISTRVIQSAAAQPLKVETVWTAGEHDGDYIVQVFAWQPADSPVWFAYSAITIAIHETRMASCAGSAECFQGTVTRIIDGDTLAVNDITIRLSLVNSPERGEAGFSEATDFMRSVCPEGSTALVDEDDGQQSGSYGRMIALVYCEGGIINEELLASENALILTQYCDESEFAGKEWATRYGC